VSRDEAPLSYAARDERPLQKAVPPPVASDGGGIHLVPCAICGRSFAEDRIDKHRVACEKSANAKPRRTFHPAKQRLGGLDCVDVRSAAKAEEEKARQILAMKKAESAVGVPKAQVMLGKDGRPLSPLSAAHARAKIGLDPYDEDPSLRPTDITPCPCCGRNFAADRLEVHLEICQKITVNSAQRRPWDSQQRRLNATLGASLGGLNSSPAPQSTRGRMGQTRTVSRENSAPSRGGTAGVGRPTSRTSADEMPAHKMPKWKRDHDAFQAAVRQGRKVSKAIASGVALSDLPPPPPVNPDTDDRILCPHCGRKFNDKAAERHIPKCSSIMAKPKTLLRGDQKALGANARAHTHNRHVL